MVLLVLGSAIAVGALAFYLTLLGRGLATSLITAAVVLTILFVSFDLDRRVFPREMHDVDFDRAAQSALGVVSAQQGPCCHRPRRWQHDPGR